MAVRARQREHPQREFRTKLKNLGFGNTANTKTGVCLNDIASTEVSISWYVRGMYRGGGTTLNWVSLLM